MLSWQGCCWFSSMSYVETLSGSFHFALADGRGSYMPKSKPTNKAAIHTVWERVKSESAAGSPIPHSPGDGPYDPNDNAAVNAFWDQATIIHKSKEVVRRGRGPQKVPTKQRITIRLSPKGANVSVRAGRAGRTASMKLSPSW